MTAFYKKHRDKDSFYKKHRDNDSFYFKKLVMEASIKSLEIIPVTAFINNKSLEIMTASIKSLDIFDSFL